MRIACDLAAAASVGSHCNAGKPADARSRFAAFTSMLSAVPCGRADALIVLGNSSGNRSGINRRAETIVSRGRIEEIPLLILRLNMLSLPILRLLMQPLNTGNGETMRRGIIFVRENEAGQRYRQPAPVEIGIVWRRASDALHWGNARLALSANVHGAEAQHHVTASGGPAKAEHGAKARKEEHLIQMMPQLRTV